MMEQDFNLCVKTDNEELANYYSSYTSHHEGDSGVDLIFKEDQTFEPNSLGNTIDLGISCSMTITTRISTKYSNAEEKRWSSYFLLPRSSIGKTPLRLSNSVGLIDAKYQGPIMAKVDNLSKEPFSIKKGEKLFQIVGPSLQEIEVEVINDLGNNGTRGTGGFGSTN